MTQDDQHNSSLHSIPPTEMPFSFVKKVFFLTRVLLQLPRFQSSFTVQYMNISGYIFSVFYIFFFCFPSLCIGKFSPHQFLFFFLVSYNVCAAIKLGTHAQYMNTSGCNFSISNIFFLLKYGGFLIFMFQNFSSHVPFHFARF